MSVVLELPPSVENRLRFKAESLGKSVEGYLSEIIDEFISDEEKDKPFYESATDEEWIGELDSLAEFSDKIPETWDDDRESIYFERETSQL